MIKYANYVVALCIGEIVTFLMQNLLINAILASYDK